MTPENLKSQEWRLNNLYYVKNEDGVKVKFRMRECQRELYEGMWYRNLILKARQLGFTTFIQIYILDCCLFNSNKTGGVIAQGLKEAKEFFRDKIKFAYDNLPDVLKAKISANTDSALELTFSNGSRISVGVSLRSGTYQYLHVSEFGKVCAKTPDKAKEIVTGALPTVHKKGIVWIESTAEGEQGYFHDMVKDAENVEPQSTLEFKLFFYPWFNNPSYTTSESIHISEDDNAYFDELFKKHDIQVSEDKKKWYVTTKKTQKGLMMQEHPSYPDEAFMRITEHAIYGDQLKKVYDEGRVCRLPYNEGFPVHLFYDLGRSKTDSTAIFFMQHIGQQYNFIDFEQFFKKSVDFIVKEIQKKGYVIGSIYLPHDGGYDDFDLDDYRDKLEKRGYNNVIVNARVNHINLGIEAVREKFSLCYFDKENCEEGLKGLRNYEWQFDEKRAAYVQPLHNWASHPSDAFRTFGEGFKTVVGKVFESTSTRRKGKFRGSKELSKRPSIY